MSCTTTISFSFISSNIDKKVAIISSFSYDFIIFVKVTSILSFIISLIYNIFSSTDIIFFLTILSSFSSLAFSICDVLTLNMYGSIFFIASIDISYKSTLSSIIISSLFL